MTLTLADFFCGAGGSSTGAVQVPGVTLRAAANHWKLACDTHAANHPKADHIVADLSQYDPRYFPRTTLGWFSPECTWHTGARGKRYDGDTNQPDMFGETLPVEAAERSRATMWDVVRFTEYHRYKAVIVENVVEIMKWPPVTAWLGAMHSLGYRHRIVSLNAMHAQAHGLPAPQSRDRVYVVFWLAGNPAPDLDAILRPKAWCPSCQQVVEAMQTWRNGKTVGKYRSQYHWRCPHHSCRGQIVEPDWLPAATIIDWSNLGQRIGDRERPLREKTRARIADGIEKWWTPFLLNRTFDYHHQGVGEPVPTVMASGTHLALAVPVEGRAGLDTAKPTRDPLRTMTTRNETGLATAPFIAELYGTGKSRSALDPLSTVTAGGFHHALITSYYGNGDTRTAAEPLSTVTTLDRHGLITPVGGTWNEDAYRTEDPMRTLTTREPGALITPAGSAWGQGAYPVSDPARTVTTYDTSALVTEGRSIEVDDCHFRMLEPSESKRAMAFPDSYVMLGTRREQQRMAGNAVVPPAARDLVWAVAESLEGVA